MHIGNALGSAKGLEPRLVGRWNKLLSHYDDSDTGKGIRNVQEVKTLYVVTPCQRIRRRNVLEG